jgi:hypothetical protein
VKHFGAKPRLRVAEASSPYPIAFREIIPENTVKISIRLRQRFKRSPSQTCSREVFSIGL